MKQEYFSLRLGDDVCLALPLEAIEMVTRIKRHKICPIPGVAAFWLGVVNQGGALLWMLDSHQFFQIVPSTNFSQESLTAIILKHQIQKKQQQVALVVDALLGVVSLSLEEKVAPTFGNHPLLNNTVVGTEGAIAIITPETFFKQFAIRSSQFAVNHEY